MFRNCISVNPEAKHLDASIVLPEIPIIPWISIDSNGIRWICIGYAQVFAQAVVRLFHWILLDCEFPKRQLFPRKPLPLWKPTSNDVGWSEDSFFANNCCHKIATVGARGRRRPSIAETCTLPRSSP